MFQLLDHGGDPSAENCMLFKTHDYIQGDILHAKKCYQSGQILVVDRRLLGKDGRVHHTAEAAKGIRAIVLFEIREAPEVWVARVSGVPRVWAPLEVDALKDTCAYLEVPLGHYAKQIAKLHGYAAAYAARALNHVTGWKVGESDVVDYTELLQNRALHCLFRKSSFGRGHLMKAVLGEVTKKSLNILSSKFPVEWFNVLRMRRGVREESLALLEKHAGDALLDVTSDVLSKIALSPEGIDAIVTAALAKFDGSVLDAPEEVQTVLWKSAAGSEAATEAWLKQHPDVLKAPPDVRKQLSKSSLGRNAISEAWIKQHPDVLNAPPDVRKQLATSSRGRAALKAKNPSKKREVDSLREELLQLERENKRLKTQSSAGFREKRAESERARAAMTDALLSKYTSTSVQSILPEDLARLKSLNTPRGWEVLSIKDAGGQVQSFEHLVQFYFTNLSNQGGSQSKKTDIVQWISNNWQTYFGSLKRLSQHQINARLSEVLKSGPYQKARQGAPSNTVYWSRVQPS